MAGFLRTPAERRLADARARCGCGRSRCWPPRRRASLYLVATSDGLIDHQGRPLGTDFSNVYAAGTYVLEGQPAAPFDPPLQHAREQAIFGAATPFYGWHYPPFFLGARRAAGADALSARAGRLAGRDARALSLGDPSDRLGLHPRRGRFGEADGWGTRHGDTPRPPLRGATLPASQGGIWLLLALAFPAVFINLGHGHNGFLTAALIGCRAAAARPRARRRRHPVRPARLQAAVRTADPAGAGRDAAAGARSFAAAATVALLVLAATLAFGADVWRAFFASPNSPARSCSNPATPAGTRSRACSPGRGCGARRCRSPTRCRAP